MTDFLQAARDYLPQLFLAAFQYTIPLTLISFVLALLVATGVALLRLMDLPKSRVDRVIIRIAKAIAGFYVWLFRSTPMIVQLFVVFYGLPSAGIDFLANAWVSAIAVFSLNTGAYASESIRGAIMAVPKGQMEAALSVGLNRWQAYRFVILPQAARISVPPLSNSFIALVKDTSLASVITIVETFYLSQQIAAKTYQVLTLYLLVAFVYAVITTVLSYGQTLLEKRLAAYAE
ncbi:MAG TPA: amino acid ABC transporter permease [Lactobacillaceae bacterium]|jgi:cystine transport system permease protein